MNKQLQREIISDTRLLGFGALIEILLVIVALVLLDRQDYTGIIILFSIGVILSIVLLLFAYSIVRRIKRLEKGE